MKEIVTPEEMEEAVFTDEKQTREENIRQITEQLEEAFAEKEEWLAVLGEAVYQYQKKTVRKMILKDHKRPDGREITRDPSAGCRDRYHSRVYTVPAMFTRGQTQILQRLQPWLRCLRRRSWTAWMRTRQASVICIIITSRLTL